MIAESVAKRYVRALFEVALERGQEDEVLALLVDLEQLYGAVPELRHAVNNPQVPPANKGAILHGVVGDQVPEVLREFLDLLVRKARVDVLGRAGTLMAQMLDVARGVRHATVTTARPLTEAQQAALRGVLAETLAADVILQTRVDEGMLGGLAVRVGDLLLDGSLRQRLEALRQHFARERELSGGLAVGG